MNAVASLVPLRHPDRLFIGGEWVQPSSPDTFRVTDSHTEEVFLGVAEAREADIARAIEAARHAFDHGPWPTMTHLERAEYIRALAAGLERASDRIANIWPRESGVIHRVAALGAADSAETFNYYAGLANTFPFEEVVPPTAGGEFGLRVREPVGVVGAIIA